MAQLRGVASAALQEADRLEVLAVAARSGHVVSVNEVFELFRLVLAQSKAAELFTARCTNVAAFFWSRVKQRHRLIITCQSGCDHTCVGQQGLVAPLRNGCKAQVCSVSARDGEKLVLRRTQRVFFETGNSRSGFVVY